MPFEYMCLLKAEERTFERKVLGMGRNQKNPKKHEKIIIIQKMYFHCQIFNLSKKFIFLFLIV